MEIQIQSQIRVFNPKVRLEIQIKRKTRDSNTKVNSEILIQKNCFQFFSVLDEFWFTNLTQKEKINIFLISYALINLFFDKFFFFFFFYHLYEKLLILKFICLSNDGSMRWFRKNEDSDDIYIEKSKYNVGIMVYGAIGYNYKSELAICEIQLMILNIEG